MVSVMLYPWILCVALLNWICLTCVLSVCELFGETIRNMLGVVVVLEVFSVGGGALLVRPYMVFQRMCVLCL